MAEHHPGHAEEAYPVQTPQTTTALLCAQDFGPIGVEGEGQQELTNPTCETIERMTC